MPTKLPSTSEQLLDDYYQLIYVEGLAKNDPKALKLRNRIITSNHKLVLHTIEKYFKHVAFLDVEEDLRQEGLIGLISAIDGFNPSKGFKFSTYATVWIKNSIINYLTYTLPQIRVPVHVKTQLNKLTKEIIKNDESELAKDRKLPTLAELKEDIPDLDSKIQEAAKSLGYGKSTLASVMKASETRTRPAFNTDAITSAMEYRSTAFGADNPALMTKDMTDAVEKLTEPVQTIESSSDYAFIIDYLTNYIGNMTPRNRAILLLRFGVIEKANEVLGEFDSDTSS